MFDFKSMLSEFRRRPAHARERRLHNRATLYWREQGKNHAFPLVSTFDASQIEDFYSHGFLLDLAAGQEPIVAEIGAVLREEADLPEGPVPLRDVRPTSLLGQFGARHKVVLEEQQPLTSEYVFTTEAGYRVSCRGVLLPLSSEGLVIDHVYGVVSWKSERVAEEPVALSGMASGGD